MSKPAEPTPDVAYYPDGSVRYRGFQLDGEMSRRVGVLPARRQPDALWERSNAASRRAWRTFSRDGRVVKETDYSKRPAPHRLARRLAVSA